MQGRALYSIWVKFGRVSAKDIRVRSTVHILAPLYLFISMGIVYFIAKFFEARADLQSAVKIGQPKALAEALQKIVFRKLQYERMPTFKIQSWTTWDPHRSKYFRIDRPEKMETPVETKHPLVQSAKDVFNGFRSVF